MLPEQGQPALRVQSFSLKSPESNEKRFAFIHNCLQAFRCETLAGVDASNDPLRICCSDVQWHSPFFSGVASGMNGRNLNFVWTVYQMPNRIMFPRFRSMFHKSSKTPRAQSGQMPCDKMGLISQRGISGGLSSRLHHAQITHSLASCIERVMRLTLAIPKSTSVMLSFIV